MQLAEKVAVVTGASRGLGRAIALQYATEGAHLVICARGATELAKAEAEMRATGAEVVAMPADVSRPDHVDELMRRAVETFGGIDVLVNNAGIAPGRGPVVETPLHVWQEILEVNLTGVFLCCRSAVPYMRRAKRGSVINVSSRIGRGLISHGWGAYAASKWGVEGLSRYLAEELEADGIRVNTVAPGLLATQLTGFEGGAPESIVDLFVFLASDQARSISGRALLASTWREELGR